jgi:UDP-N-acetylglucosamine--N-acetylmuramyl-(pentapeptide) pyrophosphoryl-undecaprenol N-acetylglucosamine transferase
VNAAALSTTGCFAVIAGGGTAGHVLPALAIAEALVERGHPREAIHLVGARRGMETRLVPAEGYPHTFYDVVGVQRAWSWANLRRNVAFGPKLLAATARASSLLGRLRPRVVVSVGGYASLPTSLAAIVRRVPLVVVSYDAVPGAASRIAARFATASAVAFPDIRLPRRHVTGAPVRAGVRAVDRDSDRGSARATLGLPADRFCVAVFGGSLGSGLLNTATSELVQRWTLRSDVAVRHVVGERFLAAASPPQDGRNGMLYQVIGYEERMPLVYAAVDLVVARAGAGTVAELAAVGVPSLLVPWAGAADDHQSRNARWLADAGGATIVSEQEFDAGVLGAEIDRLRAAPAAVAAMAAAAREAGAVHRSGALADLIEDVAR